METLKHIWGKAKRNRNENKSTYDIHPLVCHLIDVAAVAECVWESVFSDETRQWVSNALFQDENLTKKYLCFIAGLHDLGKATPVFQSKITELAEKLNGFGLSTINAEVYHSILSGELITKLMEKSHLIKLELGREDLMNLKYIIGGHHGLFPNAGNFLEILPIYLGDGSWKEVQNLLFKIVGEFTGLLDNSILADLNDDFSIFNANSHAILVYIAGFISVVDWIGSNEYFFPYYNDFSSVSELKEKYFPKSRKNAQDAIRKIGWIDWISKNSFGPPRTFSEIFHFKNLRPLQSEVVKNREEVLHPSLVIIEAPMGEGKTEAALYLEHYLEQTSHLQGAYIALPTQATSNQMFQRVKKFLDEIKAHERVNLHLLHGNALISEEYSQLKTNSKNFNTEESHIVADEWFTYRKRGVISPFGVGTIDQILLGVLPLKHFFVRLFGLANKIIIIDEVHSYDVYMSTILNNLLIWLRLLGSTVILLSATLPSFKRKELINTYYQSENTIPKVVYPRLTICNEFEMKSVTFESQIKKQDENRILLRWIEENNMYSLLHKKLINGGRVAIICNKVRRAQNIFLELKSLKKIGIEIELIHSRFPYIWREKKESLLLDKFGNKRDATAPTRILVSTQIIEQSLDLDFDLMISDLAPIDLLFQRMGRLHRHITDKNGSPIKRPKNLTIPEFWIFKPNLDKYSIPQFKYPIYSKYILLKTFLRTWFTRRIAIPDDLEKMIESVYSKENFIPPEFQKHKTLWEDMLVDAKNTQDNKDEMMDLMARYKMIPDPTDEDFFHDIRAYLDEYEPRAQKFMQALTRITIPSIQLVCLYQSGDSLFLDVKRKKPIELNKAPTDQEGKQILNYSIKVSDHQLFTHFTNHDESVPTGWKKHTLTKYLHFVKLQQEENSDKYYFEVNNKVFYLDKDLGLYKKKQKG